MRELAIVETPRCPSLSGTPLHPGGWFARRRCWTPIERRVRLPDGSREPSNRCSLPSACEGADGSGVLRHRGLFVAERLRGSSLIRLGPMNRWKRVKRQKQRNRANQRPIGYRGQENRGPDLMKMMKSQEIASHLHLSESTVRAYARQGRIPFKMTPGGHRRFDLDEVVRALDALRLTVSESRTTVEAPGVEWEPLRRGHSRRRGITRSTIADAKTSQGSGAIPFIGTRGASRFIAGRGAKV